ncbi:MAG TPA: AAA family ATPase [Tepidisphaeraceae bacterium]|nr:AAA family ATPase [Tepidisphaeraceae bacterium]
MTDRQKLEQLYLTRHPVVTIQTFEEEYVLGLYREIAVEGQCELWIWSATDGLHDGLVANSTPIADTDKPAPALYFLSRERRKPGIYVMLDLAGYLKDDRVLRCLREAIANLGKTGCQVIMIDQSDALSPVITSMAARFVPSLPDEEELQTLLKTTLRQLNEQRRIDVHLSHQDLQNVIRNLQGLSRRQARQVILDTTCVDCRFDASDISAIIAEKRQAIGNDGVLKYVDSPVSLDEIGGLKNLKQWLCRRQDCLGDEAVAFGITPPRGVLMLGIQGAGKSLSAKAVATAWQRPLLRLDAGALYDRYIGESERRLRDALSQAERMAPVILWIDEIEKGFASAASQSTDGGLSKRMFGSLLTWMQEHTAPVFLVATANDIEALPPELLRKGRFDEIFFIGLPNLEARTQIISIHLKKRKRDPAQFDLAAIAAAAEGFSGAEIEQAIISALNDAFAARQQLATSHILTALKASPPLSVTMAEKLQELEQWSQGRCVPAD